MHFSKLFLVAASICLAGLALAVPLPQSLGDDELSLIERSLEAEIEYALELRALTNAQRGAAAAKIVQKQHQRKAAKAARKPANRAQQAADKTAANNRKAAAKAAGQKKPTPMTKAQVAARKDARNPGKAARRTRFQPASPAQKAAKKAAQTARRAARPAGVKGPATTPKKARMSAADKQDVRNHVKNAAQRMTTMTNLPARNANLQLTTPAGTVTRNGRDVRQAAMNSHLHAAAPVGGGHGASRVPTGFENRPYRAPAGGPAHPRAGQNPIPGAPVGRGNGLSEFPVKNGGAGYHGSGDKGKVRIITDNRANTFQGVVTHQPGAPQPGTKRGDHFQMT